MQSGVDCIDAVYAKQSGLAEWGEYQRQCSHLALAVIALAGVRVLRFISILSASIPRWRRPDTELSHADADRRRRNPAAISPMPLFTDVPPRWRPAAAP
jgi:hypothetical protein